MDKVKLGVTCKDSFFEIAGEVKSFVKRRLFKGIEPRKELTADIVELPKLSKRVDPTNPLKTYKQKRREEFQKYVDLGMPTAVAEKCVQINKLTEIQGALDKAKRFKGRTFKDNQSIVEAYRKNDEQISKAVNELYKMQGKGFPKFV